jgi:hypothetical protein
MTSLRPAISMRAKSPAMTMLSELHEPAWLVIERRRPAEAQPSPTGDGEVPWVALPSYTLCTPGTPPVALHLTSASSTDSMTAKNSAIFVRSTGDILSSTLRCTILERGA